MGLIGIEHGRVDRYEEEPGVTKVVIPDGVTKIGDNAFAGTPWFDQNK